MARSSRKPAPVPQEHASNLFKLYFLDGDSHVCGRGPEPVSFEPTYKDPVPHAFVRRSFGDWLILEEGRYEWAEAVEP